MDAESRYSEAFTYSCKVDLHYFFELYQIKLLTWIKSKLLNWFCPFLDSPRWPRIFHLESLFHRTEHCEGKKGNRFPEGHDLPHTHRVEQHLLTVRLPGRRKVKEGSKRVKSQAYWAAVKQHQLGDTDVDPDSQALVVEHVVDLQEMEQNYHWFHQQGRRDNEQRNQDCLWSCFMMKYLRNYIWVTDTV